MSQQLFPIVARRNVIPMLVPYCEVKAKIQKIKKRKSKLLLTTPVNWESFLKKDLLALLDQEGAEGIKTYVGSVDDGLIHVAVDAYGNDIEGLVLTQGHPCPPHCDSVE